jgi:hypothetical protein
MVNVRRTLQLELFASQQKLRVHSMPSEHIYRHQNCLCITVKMVSNETFFNNLILFKIIRKMMVGLIFRLYLSDTVI